MRALTAASSSVIAAKSFLKVMCSFLSPSTCARMCPFLSLVLLSFISVTAASLESRVSSRSMMRFVPITASRAPSFCRGALAFAFSSDMKSALYSPRRCRFSKALASAALILASSSALALLLSAICFRRWNFCFSRDAAICCSSVIGPSFSRDSSVEAAAAAAAAASASSGEKSSIFSLSARNDEECVGRGGSGEVAAGGRSPPCNGGGARLCLQARVVCAVGRGRGAAGVKWARRR
jgi:hypothetical protein